MTALASASLVSPALAAFKDQSRLPLANSGPTSKKPQNDLLPDSFLPSAPVEKPKKEPVPDGDEKQTPAPLTNSDDPVEPYDINEIPELIPVVLTPDVAKRAIDGFADVGTRYDDKGVYDYPTLKEFVDKTEAGKQLERDIKKYGFKNIVEWNIAIMNVSYAYGALLQDQEEDIRRQIRAVEKDKTLSADRKQRVIASLNALIPSKENVKLIREINKLPIYQEKLNLLNVFE